jgi:pimeloyl-ACP methyl ester carboxylesterase
MPTSSTSRRRAAKRLIALLAIALAVAVVWRPVRAHVQAASLLLRFVSPRDTSVLAGLYRSPLREVPFTVRAPRGEVRARLYSPQGKTGVPGIVIVHGVHRLGIEEPRLVHFARTIAATGLVVLTPEVGEIADYRIDPASVETMGASARALAEALGVRRVGMMGLSFAGGLGLIAAADPHWAPYIGWVVSVGGHHDLERVLRFFLSNAIQRPDGSLARLEAHDYGALILVYNHVEAFFPAEDVPAAREAVKHWLGERFQQAKEDAQRLSPAARARAELLFAGKTEALAGELGAEIERLKPGLGAVSPGRIEPRIKVPMFFLHGAGDSVIPATESLWLAHDAPAGTLGGVLVSNAITHVELHGKPTIAEEWALVHFMAGILAQASRE